MQSSILDHIELANTLVSLYTSTYARANFLVQLQTQKTSLPSLADIYKRKENNLQAKISEIEGAVKCAAADVFLLLISREKHTASNANGNNYLDCMGRYHDNKSTHRDSQQANVAAYKNAISNNKFKEANQLLIQIFDIDRQVSV